MSGSPPRQTMKKAEGAGLPGSDGGSGREGSAEWAKDVGYPVILKAVAGGGAQDADLQKC